MRGFTLYEALVTLALTAVVLAVSGQILANYSRLIRQTHTRAGAREAAAHGLRTLARELRGAVSWSEPASGRTSARLTWTRYTVPGPDWIALAQGPTWDARAAGAPVASRAWLQGNVLRWEAQPLADNIASFSVTRPGDTRMNLTVQVRDAQRTLSLKATALRMLP